MLRFRLGSIPVEVHPSHFLLIAVFAFSPGRPLNEVLVWMALISFSVLFHELGHALTSLAFGYRPAISLAWLGGNTRPNAPAPIPWFRDVALTLAGPGFGLLLAAASYAGARSVGGGAAEQMLLQLCFINVIWAGLNLFPVLPLDGGRIAYAVLTRILGGRGALVTWGVSAVVAGGSALVAAVVFHETWAALLFSMFAFQSGRAFVALWQGQSSASDPPALAEARAHYARGELKDAWQKVESLTQDPKLSPAIRSRAEHLLGWIALKEGKGRLALDHFSQVSRQRVEPEALAAAFSLLGDDLRALPLWELACRENPGATLRQEWGGTLIRLRRPEDARKLPNIDLVLAYGCAERVYFLREEFALAAEAGKHAFEASPSMRRAYDIACASARAGRAQEALEWLEKARLLGFSDVSQAEKDPDLLALHGRPDFDAWRQRL